jgi:hypothetical protein
MELSDMGHPVYLRKDVTDVMAAEAELVLVNEDGLDGGFEETGEFEGQWEAGVVLAGLDGVDGLAGDLEAFGEVGLGPVAFGAEDAKAVVHLSDTSA